MAVAASNDGPARDLAKSRDGGGDGSGRGCGAMTFPNPLTSRSHLP